MTWCESHAGLVLPEQLYYSMWNGQRWSEPNDIVPPNRIIERNAIATDHINLYLLVRQHAFGEERIYFKQAPIEAAWSADSWSAPRLISGGGSYYADIVVDSQGIIHIIYNSNVLVEVGDLQLPSEDIFYRHSADGGQTWSSPLNLSKSQTACTRPQMEVDERDTIYVVWDEVVERTGRGESAYSRYVSSSDGGGSWSEPVTFSYPEADNAQITVAGDGRDGVLVVWRSVSRDEIYYAWSSDGGASWSAPATIPGIFARPWASHFDMYDMATDSGGHIHLVVVGRDSPEEESLRVYHLEWDGTSWLSPTAIYWGTGFPEYPKVVIARGNQLHVAWFVRETLWEGGNHEVWYSRSQTSSPPQTPVPPPTLLPTPMPQPSPTATPTATPYPTVAPGQTTALPDGLNTESDELLRLLIGLAPVLILVMAIFAIRLAWVRRSSGR
jgi:hypothetical protein